MDREETYGTWERTNFKESNEINSEIKFKVTQLGLIASGCGIGPIFQLVNRIVENKDKMAMSLVYHNFQIVFR